LVLLALISVASFAANEKVANEITHIPPKVHTIATPTETTVNVMCQDLQRESTPKEVEKQAKPPKVQEDDVLTADKPILISVVGQGVAPVNTTSPAQAYALAKRAATADAYRLIAEKVKGVNIDGQDLIKNMMVKRSTIRTSVQAMVRNANIVETTFKDGLCEVEMEITLSHSEFAQ
jgi:hypothetical protein